MATDDAARERSARNETLFRQVNERVRDVSEAFAALDPSEINFVCECGDEQCTEPVSLTLAEYERVRGVPTHFFVVPEHVIPKVEVVVRRSEGYVVVDKLPGHSDLPVETDPRA
jgi:hypothetical protein